MAFYQSHFFMFNTNYNNVHCIYFNKVKALCIYCNLFFSIFANLKAISTNKFKFKQMIKYKTIIYYIYIRFNIQF